MKRNGKSEQARVQKKESDHAQKRFAIFKINFSSRRNERRDDLWIDNEIEHGEITPVRAEKRSHPKTVAKLIRWS
jgi:hypothetical protein